MVKEVQLEGQVHGVEEGLETESQGGASRAEDHQGGAGDPHSGVEDHQGRAEDPHGGEEEH